MNAHPVINRGFCEAVENHIFGNLLLADTQSPLILGIFGPPGEGKTFQLDWVCRDLGIKQVLVSPGELESENAGQPGFVLRREYLSVGEVDGGPARSRDPAVLVVNDIDTVLGDWGELVQYTVNRQVVYGQLMAFCDHPHQVAGKETRRVPIILTGNNPSILYRPLLRPGRMRVMRWEPTVEDKTEIVSGLFPSIPSPELHRLIRGLMHQPVSFWSDAKAWIWEQRMRSWVSRNGRETLTAALKRGQQLQQDSTPVTASELASAVQELNSNNTSMRSFLTTEVDSGREEREW